MRTPVLLLLVAGAMAGTVTGCGPTSRLPAVSAAEAAAEAARQKQLAVLSYRDEYVRLFEVATPILIGSAALCGARTARYSGIVVGSVDSFGADFKQAARTALGLDDRLAVIHVVAGSPADRAGVVQGMTILDVAGKPAPSGRLAGVKFQELATAAGERLELTVEGAARHLAVPQIEMCDYDLAVVLDDSVNAFANGEGIVLTRGMMRFAAADPELAAVVGHELAHNVLRHVDKKKAQAIPGLLVDLLFAAAGISTGGLATRIAAQAYSQGYEAEADYVGLYLMARAGYDITAVPDFWRRMGANRPGAISHATTHPTTAQRYVALDKAVREIAAKQAAGQPLLPETEFDPPTRRQRQDFDPMTGDQRL